MRKDNILMDSILNIVLNIVTFIVSALTVVVIPRFVGVEIYSYYQLYLFYIAYVGALNFGLPEGVLLREAGKKYHDLNKPVLSFQFWGLTLLEIIIYISLLCGILMFEINTQMLIIYSGISACAIIMNSKWLLSFLLNATGNVKVVSIIGLIEKTVIIVMVGAFIILGTNGLIYIIIADLVGHIVSTILTIYMCRDIVFSFEKIDFSIIIYEIKQNISAGIKLLIATLSSLLILGIIRIGIEKGWDIITFGKISLTISISNILMQIVSSVANVIYPRLKHFDTKKLQNVYIMLKSGISYIVFFCFMFYYPCYSILSNWLPNYSDSLRYAAILFPICYYECRTNLVCKTYMQALRKEKTLMIINCISVLLSLMFTIMFAMIVKNLNMIIMSILIVLGVRNILMDLAVSYNLNTKFVKDTVQDTIMICVFILLNWNFGFIGMIVYMFIFVAYIVINRDKISKIIKVIKTIR